MTESFRNRTFSTPRHSPARIYPVAQWHHQRDGVPGGLEIPVRYFQDAALTLLDPIDVPHGPRTETAWLLPRFHLAVAGLRPVLWERRRGEVVEIAPEDLESPWELGYRSRRRLLVIVKELWDAGYQDFLVATFRATSSQDISRVLFAAGRFRLAAGQTGEGSAFPEHAFYVPAQAGEPTEISSRDGSQSSWVTPIECLLPQQPAEQDFERLVIPPDVQRFIEARLDEVEQWESQEGSGDSAWPANGNTAASTQSAESTSTPAADPADQSEPPRRGNGDGAPKGALRVPAPIGTRTRPDYQGRPLGDLLQEWEGRRLVQYLATRFQPKDAAALQAVKAAKALVAAGLTV